MKVFFISNEGAAAADIVDVPCGTTPRQLIQMKLGNVDVNRYQLRVNRLQAAWDSTLQEDARVTVTPIKVEGGRRA